MQEKSHSVKAALLAGVVWACAWSPLPALGQLEMPRAPDEPPSFSQPSPIGPLEYRPGRGLRVGDTGLTAGGYGNLTLARDEGDAPSFDIDELAGLFAWDPHPRIHGFIELELEDVLESDPGDHGGPVDEAHFRVERAYGDFHLLDPLTIRIGKFLTPVGRWNVIHAAPLVWTTSRPVTTERPFDDNTTGAQLFGSFYGADAAVTYRLFGQFVDQLDERSQPIRQSRSAGVRLELALGAGPELGATFLTYKRPLAEWSQLGGVDFFWQAGRLEMLSEAVVDESDDQGSTEWGGFLQLAYEVAPHWFAIGRYEHFDPRGVRTAVSLFDVAAAFRPRPNLIFKAEYLFADRRSEIATPGFKSSLAFMF